MRRARAVRHTLARDLEILGIPLPRLKATDHEHARELLAEWKSGVLKKAYRAAVKATHPDHNPDDPDAALKFQAVKEAFERASSIDVRPPRPPAPPPMTPERAAELHRQAARSGIVVGRPRGVSRSFTTGGSTTSAATNTVNFGPWHTVTITW